MSFLFKPTTISYRDPNGRRCGPNEAMVIGKDGKAVLRRGFRRDKNKTEKWYGRYTDRDGVLHQVKLLEGKDDSRKLLTKIAGDSLMAQYGLNDRYEDQRLRPLLHQVEDYSRYLQGKGNTKEHVAKTSSRIRALLAGCQFENVESFQAAAVVDFLADLRNSQRALVELDPRKERYTKAELSAIVGVHPDSVARLIRRDNLAAEGEGKARRYPAETVKTLQARLGQGIGIGTVNHYLTAIKAFTRWLTRERRIPADPLSHLARQNPQVDVRRTRRALKEEAFNGFVEATGKGKSFRGLTGADRLVLYSLAANTGLRAGELASLTPASFSLESDPPTVRVEAAYSKHRRDDVQPLRGDLAEMIRQYVAGKPRRQPLWPGTWKGVAAEMLRVDLAAAGIPYQDDDGRYFDFHAMRGQFISVLAAGGVHPKVAQVLARHSDIRLTMKAYTHLDVLDVAGALEKLPSMPGQPTAQAGGKSRVQVQTKYKQRMA